MSRTPGAVCRALGMRHEESDKLSRARVGASHRWLTRSLRSTSAGVGRGGESPRCASSACTTWRWSASDANQSRGNAMRLARRARSTSTGDDLFHGTERRRK